MACYGPWASHESGSLSMFGRLWVMRLPGTNANTTVPRMQCGRHPQFRQIQYVKIMFVCNNTRVANIAQTMQLIQDRKKPSEVVFLMTSLWPKQRILPISPSI